MNIRLLLRLSGLVVLTSTLNSCSTFENEEEAKMRAVSIIESRREASVSDWKEISIDDGDVLSYVARRTFFLVAGRTNTDATTLSKDEESIRFQLNFRGSDPITMGCAAAISNDGYFLTAAHCVETPNINLFVVTHDKELVQARARVISLGSTPDEPDIALLHANVRPYDTFPISDWSSIRTGESIFISGFAGGKQTRGGGKILKIHTGTRLEPNQPWVEFEHDAPLSPGDSGGPVVNSEGELLGINSMIGVGMLNLLGKDFLTSYRATAIGFHPNWLQEQIDKDRALRRSWRELPENHRHAIEPEPVRLIEE